MSTLNNSTNLTDTIAIQKQNGTTITLNTNDTYVDKDIVLTINVSDENLVAENIKDGVSILGITGTGLTNILLEQDQNGYVELPEVGGANVITPPIDISDTTLTADKAASDYYFYDASGTKIQGSLIAQAAQTIIPTTTDQTIARGKYLTGAQTIKGDVNLVAANIAEGISIFGVTGTHSGNEYPFANGVSFGTVLTYINFSISGDPYQAGIEMTWLEWCNSAYNTSTFSCQGPDDIIEDSFYRIIYVEGRSAKGSDIIINGKDYYTMR